MSDEVKFEKRLTLQVSVQIIKHISSGLYRSPASALKELISNSFDADAHNVLVDFHFSYDSGGNLYLDYIQVKDNGNGMDLKTLEYIFTHIGGSTKGVREEKTPEGRDIIGRLGIGMLSVAAACRSFVVRTKRTDEEREYSANISLSFFEDLRELTETMDKFSIGNVNISSRSVTGFEKYTIVEIHDFRPPFLSNILEDIGDSYFFQEPLETDENIPLEKQYQSYWEDFLEQLAYDEKLLSTPVLDQIIGTVGLMAPVEYLPDGPVRSKVIDRDGTTHEIPGTSDQSYISIREKLKKLDFNVKVRIIRDHLEKRERSIKNEFKLYKPLLYPSKRDIKEKGFETLDPYVYPLEPKKAEIENEPGEVVDTLIRGYVYHQNVRVLPHEYRGILYRVYNVAIGDYFRDELRLYSEDPIVLHQLIVEVYLDRGFQTIVNLDRETLFEGARTYQYLRAYLDNLFKGKTPARPPIRHYETSSTNPRTDTKREVVEREHPRSDPAGATASNQRDVKFFKTLSDLLPERSGIISDIKERRVVKRAKRIEKKDPTDGVMRVAKEVLRKKDIRLEPTTTLDDFGLILIDEQRGTATINIPRFRGTRAKTWESIFAAAALWGPEDVGKRSEFMKALYTIYEISEGVK